jgi:hypothetical protein
MSYELRALGVARRLQLVARSPEVHALSRSNTNR